MKADHPSPFASREIADIATQTLDGTLPYEETWRANAEAVLALGQEVETLRAGLEQIAKNGCGTPSMWWDGKRCGERALEVLRVADFDREFVPNCDTEGS